MTMVVLMPSILPASATACAWLPEENAITPFGFFSCESALYAPRNLKAPMFCRFSHLKNTLAPVIESMAGELSTGVRTACGLMRSCAAAMSAYVTVMVEL